MKDINQARDFISALTGSASSLVTFQVFFDPKPPHPQRKDLAATWTNTLDASMDFINHRQSNQCGLYMCINGTDGLGREVDNIVDLRVFFVDFDGMDEPQWVVEPHVIQKRDNTHGHAFWLIDAGDLSHDDWTETQKRLSLYYGTDGQVVDPARVVRIPGSYHYKDPSNPVSYEITTNKSAQLGKYSPSHIVESHPLSDELETFLTNWSEAKKGINEGVGYEATKQDVEKFTSFVTHAAHPAVLGSGTLELIKVASFGHDHGVPLSDAQEILWENYNPRCEPPWENRERYHFNQVVQRAYKYATSAPGCKTAKAGFLAVPLPEPTCGWDNQREQFGPKESDDKQYLSESLKLDNPDKVRSDDDRVSADTGAMMLASIDGKGEHYEFARIFDGMVYDGTDLLRVAKQFYVFNGRVWRQIDDEVIKSQVQRMLKQYKPADSMTSGVFRCLCDLVTIEVAENGTWLSEPNKDTSNLAVFKNGIVDLSSDKPELMPHTYEFFCFNELSYDYQPESRCPQWLNFLESIWPGNNDLKRQLQQWIGYCLTRDTSLQKYAIFMGKPRAGKGVITDVIAEMIGDANVSSPSLSNLVKDSTLDKMSTSAVAMIPDAHNVHINVRDAVLSNLKAIIGEDKISWHRMYKGGQTGKMTLKIMMSTNNIPDFVDPSGALVARMLIFPFTRSFMGKEDTTLRERLRAEVPGILQWAIAGLRDLRSNGGKFTEAKEGLIEKEEIREDMFPLSQFTNEMCKLEPGVFTRIEDLYNTYRLWAVSNGIKNPMSMIGFNKCLRNSSLPISHGRVDGMRGFTGLTVQSVTPSNVVGFPPV